MKGYADHHTYNRGYRRNFLVIRCKLYGVVRGNTVQWWSTKLLKPIVYDVMTLDSVYKKDMAILHATIDVDSLKELMILLPEDH